MDGSREAWIRYFDAQEERRTTVRSPEGLVEAPPTLSRRGGSTGGCERRARRAAGPRTSGCSGIGSQDPALRQSEPRPAAGGSSSRKTAPSSSPALGPARRTRWSAEGPRFGANRDRPARGDRLRHLHAQGRQEIRDRSGDLPGMEIGTIHHLARVVIMRLKAESQGSPAHRRRRRGGSRSSRRGCWKRCRKTQACSAIWKRAGRLS